jgi:hypothetical protein
MVIQPAELAAVDLAVGGGGDDLGHPRREGENNRTGRRDGECSSLIKFGDRERWNGEEDILAIKLPRLLERCFG